MKVVAKKLTLSMIDFSPEISLWLLQLKIEQRITAKSLLSRLQFISRDDYSSWLIEKLKTFSAADAMAIYAIRKFQSNCKSLWKEDGSVQPRPATTQGSEDLVASIISNANKECGHIFFDHPSIEEIRNKKVRNIVLIDDSIGSGKRVCDYLALMFSNKTFLSWWSGGYIKIHILSYARTSQAERKIMCSIPGSKHGIRLHSPSSKIFFTSNIVFNSEDLSCRWGHNASSILSLCDSVKAIKLDRRRGFGDVMGCIIFYHSVPNNIPGMIYSKSPKWAPLFPDRALPSWVISLLEAGDRPTASEIKTKNQDTDILNFLLCLKSGLRKITSIARRMDSDISMTKEIFSQCRLLGFVTSTLRLTPPGEKFLKNKNKNGDGNFNQEIYIPDSWCVDQRTIQPSRLIAEKPLVKTDSTDFSVDGDGGMPSLERTDAKATSSPMRGVTKAPFVASESSLPSWPHGLKE